MPSHFVRRLVVRTITLCTLALTVYLICTPTDPDNKNIRFSQPLPPLPPPLPPLPDASLLFITRTTSLTKVRRTMFDFQRRFNDRHNYPYLFLSEQPFSDTFKRAVQLMAPNSAIRFGLIDPEHWELPLWVDRPRVYQSAAEWDYKHPEAEIGWRHMARYWSMPFALHPQLKGFRYVWRLEPGSHFTCDLELDPLRHLHEHSIAYGYSIRTSIGNYTDPGGMEELVREYSKYTSDYSVAADFPHYLSSSELLDLTFLRSAPYQSWFHHLDRLGGIYYHRWTDSSIRTLGLRHSANRTHWFQEIGFVHDSHHNCPPTPQRCHC